MSTTVIRTSNTDYSRRSRRGGDMDDEDESPRSRRGRRHEEEEEEEDTSRSRRSRRGGDDEEDDDSGRRTRRGRGRDEDEEDAGRSAPKKSGGTLSSMPEIRRRKIQQAVLDGMFKFAEQKYGRKRTSAAPKKRNVMDDYDIYLRSLKAKCKTAEDKVATVLRQKREVDEKFRKAEEESNKHKKVLQDAEDEKQAAIDEGRDPKLPEGFVAPAAATKKGGFANLVMKASAQLWEDKFNAMRAKKGSDDQPAWMKEKAGGRRSEKVLLNVGKARQKKTDKHEEPKWASKGGLKKTERGKGDDDKGTAFAVSLRKTKKEEKEEPEKKVDWRSRVKNKKTDTKPEAEEEPAKEPEAENEEPSEGRRSRRRRGGDDSD